MGGDGNVGEALVHDVDAMEHKCSIARVSPHGGFRADKEGCKKKHRGGDGDGDDSLAHSALVNDSAFQSMIKLHEAVF